MSSSRGKPQDQQCGTEALLSLNRVEFGWLSDRNQVKPVYWYVLKGDSPCSRSASLKAQGRERAWRLFEITENGGLRMCYESVIGKHSLEMQ